MLQAIGLDQAVGDNAMENVRMQELALAYLIDWTVAENASHLQSQ